MKEKKIIFKRLAVKEIATVKGGARKRSNGEVPGLSDCSTPNDDMYLRSTEVYSLDAESVQLINI